VNVIMDAMVGATSQYDIDRLIAGTYGIPLVQHHREQIEDVNEDRDDLVVITDQEAYGHSRSDSSLWAAGAEVTIGQPLTDAIAIYDFRRGIETLPPILGLAIPVGFLDPSIGDEIVFENQTVDTTVTGEAGEERLEWPLGGSQTAVDAFWDLTHQNRLTYGKSLYELFFDAYGAIPDQINPMSFLIEHVLRNNAMLAVIQQSGIREDALNTSIVSLLRQITPPHMAVFVIIELPMLQGVVTLGPATIELGIGMEPLAGNIWGTESQIGLWG
jgi:hypothetical protein